MARRDYYFVLGISPRESQEGIREAFRDLARRYHPDHAGPHGTRFFQEVVEAYEVLSDEQRRASYDRGLGHGESQVPVHNASSTRAARRAPAAEPLVTEAHHRQRRAEPLVPEPMHPLGGRAREPSPDEVRDRVRRSFFVSDAHAARPEALDVDLRLAPEDALQGGTVTLDVPAYAPCPRCRGSGLRGAAPCPSCTGEGVVAEPEHVRLTLPPRTRDGEVFELPLRRLGVHDQYLRVRVHVADHG